MMPVQEGNSCDLESHACPRTVRFKWVLAYMAEAMTSYLQARV